MVAGIALTVLLTAASAVAGEWQAYEDPTGTIALEVPESWWPGEPADMGFSHIVAFDLPDRGAQFTISITPNLRLPDELPLGSLEVFFPPDAKLGTPRRRRGEGWNAVLLEATRGNGAPARTWLGAFFGVGSTMVAVTLSGESGTIDSRRSVFERIVASMRFRSPRRPGGEIAT
jgi:hypothetical protein